MGGFDALVITGKSDEPCYLLVMDGGIRILPAGHLWGKDTWETETLLQGQYGDPNLRVACIGRAGENMVPLTCVMGEKVHAGGRGGTGAVMGSKNLKAVAVRGHMGVKIADPETLMAESKRLIEMLMGEYHYARYKNIGSPKGTTLYQNMGGVGAYNWQYGVFDKFATIEGDNFRTKYSVGSSSCGCCPLPCWRKYLVQEGKFKGSGPRRLKIRRFSVSGPGWGTPIPR